MCVGVPSQSSNDCVGHWAGFHLKITTTKQSLSIKHVLIGVQVDWEFFFL